MISPEYDAVLDECVLPSLASGAGRMLKDQALVAPKRGSSYKSFVVVSSLPRHGTMSVKNAQRRLCLQCVSAAPSD
jgi:hypothetical protein